MFYTLIYNGDDTHSTIFILLSEWGIGIVPLYIVVVNVVVVCALHSMLNSDVSQIVYVNIKSVY